MASCHQQIMEKIRARIGEPFRRLDQNDANFEAKRQQMQKENERQRQHALAAVDGLIAGFRFLDKVEKDPLAASPFLSLSPDSFSSSNDTATHGYSGYPSSIDFDHAAASQAKSDSPDSSASNLPPLLATQEGKAQWALLRTVKEAIDVHFDEFQAVADEKDCPKRVKELVEHFDSPKKLREVAGQVHRDILSLQRVQPSTLNEVFAYAFLSYVVSRLLVERQRLEKEAILCGLHEWLCAIEDARDQAAFRFLVQNLWPEQVDLLDRAQDEQTAINVYGSSSQALPISETTSYSSAAPAPNDAYIGWGSMGQAVHVSPHEPWDTSCVYYGSDFIPNAFRVYNPFIGDWNFANLANELEEVSPSIAPDPPPPSFLEPSPTRMAEPRPNTDIKPDDGNPSLEATAMFLVLQLLMKELKDLLYMLSGKGETVKHPKSGRGQGKLDREMAATFFSPRKESGQSNRTFHALLSIAQKWVEDGYLRSAQSVEDYLLDVAEEMLTKKEFREFQRWVLQSPSPPQSPRRIHKTRRRRASAVAAASGNGADGVNLPVTKLFQCQLCSKQYKTAAGLSKHKNDHKPASERVLITCPACSYSCGRRDRLRQHYEDVHGGNLPPMLLDRSRRRKSGSGSAGPTDGN